MENDGFKETYMNFKTFYEQEHKPSGDPKEDYEYARDIIKGRWPEAEPYIINYVWIEYYIEELLKNDKEKLGFIKDHVKDGSLLKYFDKVWIQKMVAEDKLDRKYLVWKMVDKR